MDQEITDISNEVRKKDTSISLKYTAVDDNYEANPTDIVVAFGWDAYQKARIISKNSPLIGTYISSIQFSMYNDTKHIDRDQTVILFTDPPIQKQFKLARILFPAKLELGIFLSHNSEFLRKDIAFVSDSLNVPVSIMSSASSSSFFKDLSAHANFDAIIAIPDSYIYNRQILRAIFETTYYEGTCIIGFSKGMVNAGALATTYSDSTEVADAIVKEVNQYKIKRRFGNNRYVSGSSFLINRDVARSLNIVIPSDEKIKQALEGGL